MSATLAHRFDVDRPRHVEESSLPLRLTAFVEGHLDTPGLSPASIAAAHHVSVSHLHRREYRAPLEVSRPG